MNNLEITRAISMNIAHLSPETLEALDTTNMSELGPVLEFPKLGEPLGPQGWYIHLVPEETEKTNIIAEYENSDLPEDLIACIKVAVENDCQMIIFDDCRPVIDGLPMYSKKGNYIR